MAVKTYTVKKDGQVLKAYKSLPSAKQLAEKEMANVYCDGICIYKVVPEEEESPVTTESGETATAEPTQEEKDAALPIPAAQWTLTAKMNVRKEPSLNAEIVRVLDAGSTVDVDVIKDDWMYLTDRTFIWYNGGKFAEKNTVS